MAIGQVPTERFTPTCVGRMFDRALAGASESVHPHVRGENCRHVRPRSVAVGSPPRAWGEFGRYFVQALDNRFTPTCVGRIRPGKPPADRPTVHPHVRGENTECHAGAPGCSGSPPRAWGEFSAPSLRMRSNTGSPPRAWGECPSPAGWPACTRFTPTCVGRILKSQKINPLPSPGSHADRKDASIPIRVLNIVEPPCPE